MSERRPEWVFFCASVIMAFRHPRLTVRLFYSSLHCDVQASEATLASMSRRPLTIFTNVHNNQTKFDITNYVQKTHRFIFSFLFSFL
jgi:hypothetical protein